MSGENINKKKNSNFETLIEDANEGVFIVTSLENLVYVNKKGCEISGYSKADLLDTSIKDLVHPGKYKRIVQRLKNSFKGDPVPTMYETVIVNKKGKNIPVELTASRIKWEGKPADLIFIRDITEHKQVEEELRKCEERYWTNLSSMSDLIFVLDENDRFVDAHFSSESLLYVPPEEFIGKRIGDVLPSHVSESYNKFSKKLRESGETQQFEYTMLIGGENRCYVATLDLNWDGKRVVVSVRDITERKKTEETMQQSEQKYRLLIENIPSVVWLSNVKGETVYISYNIEEIYGYSPEEIYKKGAKLWFDRIHPDDVQMVKDGIKRLINKNVKYDIQYRIKRKDGQWIWIHDKANIQKKVGEQIYIFGVFLEITDRKKAEESLRRERDRAQSYLDIAGVIIVAVNTRGEVTLINRKGCEVLGYKEEEVLGKNWFDHFVPKRLIEEVKLVSEKLLRCELKPAEYYENPVLTKSGEERLIVWRNTLLKDKGGKIIGHLSSGEDITERKRTEETLKESEERFRQFFENEPEYCYMISPESVIIDINTAALKTLGYKKKELIGKPLKKIYHKDSYKKMEQLFLKWKKTGEVKNEEIDIVTKKGDKHTVLLSASVVKDKNGETLYSVSVQRDITNRKIVEEALQQSEQFLQSVFDGIQDGISVLDSKLNIIGVNKWMEKMYAHAKPLLGKKCYRVYQKRKSQCPWCPSTKTIRTGEISVNIVPYPSAENPTRWIELFSYPIKDKNNKVVKVIEHAKDITDRKKAEEALKESEKRFRTLFEEANDAIFIVEKDRFIDCNEMTLKIFGYKKEEILNRTPWELSPTKQPDGESSKTKALKLIKAINKGIPQRFFWKHIKKDGTPFDAEVSLSLLEIENKKYIQAIVRDVTEQKKAEEEIMKSREELRALSAHMESIREEERANISREIHDELGQALTALKIDINWLKKRLSKEQGSQIKKTESMIALIDKTFQSVKRISSELRPGLLDDLGLSSAIEWQAEEFKERTGIQYDMKISPYEIVINPKLSITIFRIFQETLTNIVRHAQATKVKVKLEVKKDQLKLEVNDNGIGISEEQMNNSTSYGIIGMKERVRMFDGNINIRGIPNIGTTVTVGFPVHKKSND